jgi:tetratricopeptide (TPR) repeat protein
MKRMHSGAVAIAILGLATAAPAQVKYNRKTKEIKVEQTEHTKKLEKRDAQPAQAAPEITADKFYQIQAQIQGDIDELIREYKVQLAETPKEDEFFLKLGFRLAEAYSTKQRFHHGQAMEAQMKADKAPNKAEKDKLLAEHKKQKELSDGALKNAIVAFRGLMDNPHIDKYPQGDEIIFYYAFTLQQAGRNDLAGEIYKQLLKKFQGSRFVPDAYLYFADRYFEQRDLSNAEAFYTKVTQFPKSPLFPYAVYKRGWVYFNQRRTDEAMRAMRETVRLTQGEKTYEPMNRAAKKDFVHFYAEADAPVNVAYQAFQALDKTDYSFKMYTFLGAHYMDMGKADKAIYVYHHLIALKPRDPLVCEWQYNVARATMSAGTNTDKVRELSNLVKLYTAIKGWKPAMPQQNFDECRENAAGVTGELAMLWHAEGIKTLNFQTLGDAESLYHVYLDNFPDAENALTMQVNYAELLWNRAAMEKDSKMQPKRWEATAAEHSKVVQWKGVAEAQRKDSAYATVLAWKNALAVDVSTDVTEVSDAEVQKPEPIPEKEKKMMEAFQVYLTYITDKKDDERTQILFFTGRLYWRHRHYDEAVKYLSQVVNEAPEHEAALFAANLLLDSLNKAGRHAELGEWVKRMGANEKLMAAHPELKNTLGVLYVESIRKDAESLEKQKDYRACGFAYEKLQLENPNDPKINEILYNAAVCFKKAGMIGRAIAFRQKLTNRPGAEKDPLAQKAQFHLGDDYTSIAMYDKAAEMYEAFATRFAGEKDAPKALFYAQFFRRGLGQDQKAIENTESYVKQFAKKEAREAANAYYSIANIYEKNKETDKFVSHLDSYLRQWRDKGGVDLEIAAHVRAGEALWKQSCPKKGEKGSCIEITRERALRDAGRRGKRKATTAQTQCGDVSKNKIAVYERKPQLVKEAQSHFRKALDIWKRTGPGKISGKDEADKAQRTADAIRYAAAAEFYLAEAKYEEFLGLKFPDKLNFDPAKAAKMKESQKRFGKWFEDKTKMAAQISAQYGSIVDTATSGGANINAAQWAIAGAARMGQTLQNFSDALFTAEIPKDVQAYQDAVDAYCDELTNRADPLEKKAIEAFSFCLDSSNKLNWYNEWSQLCEGELAQIRPQDFPAAGEIRAQPYNVPAILDSQPIVGDNRVSGAGAAATAASAAEGGN